MEPDTRDPGKAVNLAVPRLGIREDPQKSAHFLIRTAEDHIERLELAVREVAIPALGIDRHDAEGVVEEDGMARGIFQAGPAGTKESSLNITRLGWRSMILGLGNTKGDRLVGPLDH